MKDANPKYACYCSKVTEEQVVDAVLKHGAKTAQEVNDITGALKNFNRKVNNPMGVCCHKIIEEAINNARWCYSKENTSHKALLCKALWAFGKN